MVYDEDPPMMTTPTITNEVKGQTKLTKHDSPRVNPHPLTQGIHGVTSRQNNIFSTRSSTISKKKFAASVETQESFFFFIHSR